jgi:Protein of unknown function (DUF3563)
MLQNIMKSICQFFNNICMNEEEAYLSRAIDLADLEQRIKKIDAGAFSNKFNWQ